MYDVALLIERELAPLDADQIIALHEGLDEPVTYHVLLPVESTPAMLATSLSALGAGQLAPVTEPDIVIEAQEELVRVGTAELEASAALLRDRGQQVTTTLTEDDPVHALTELVAATSSAEAIILTEPHLVRDFLHLDWTSRARRKLDVPILHLLEHVPFSAQP